VNCDEPHLKTKVHLPAFAPGPREPQHVLLAEDDEEIRPLLVKAFVREGYRVTECYHGLDLLDHVDTLTVNATYVRPEDREHYDLIVSGIQMYGANALEVLRDVQHFRGLPPVILITAFGDEDIRMQACELGVASVFDKPFEFDDLLAKARELVPPQHPQKQ
jgi:DNA-binding response OmpR family regulator